MALSLTYNFTVGTPPSFPYTLLLSSSINTGSNIEINWGDGTITTGQTISHDYATSGIYTVLISGTNIDDLYPPETGQEYLTKCNSFGNIGLTRLFYTFSGATNLILVPNSLPPNITLLTYVFSGATSFNQNISSWDVSNVQYMNGTFFNAISFNQNISSWDVSNVIDMYNMLNNTALSVDNYNALLNGWSARLNLKPGVTLGAEGLVYNSAGLEGHNKLTRAPNNWIISDDTYDPTPIVCFKEGTKILTNNGYIPIENLKKGDLVKTLKHDFVPINMIGKREIYNPSLKDRIKYQLYKCSQDQYPEVFEPLIITGCHSILIENCVTPKQIEQTKEVLGGIYFTDDKYMLPVCIDERASIYEIPGNCIIYHIALDNSDYYMKYGIYANGLLVETCSQCHLKELSQMEFINF